jgi:hypothetical protein
MMERERSIKPRWLKKGKNWAHLISASREIPGSWHRQVSCSYQFFANQSCPILFKKEEEKAVMHMDRCCNRS